MTACTASMCCMRAVAGLVLALALAAANACAESFFDGVFFDTAGIQPPQPTNRGAFAAFLDAHPDAFAHAKAVIAACGASNAADGAALFAERLDEAADDPLRVFDAALANVMHGCATGDDAAIGAGLASLKTVCTDTGNPGMWLSYALCLAHVDIFQIGRSRYRSSPMKDVAMQAVRRAMELDARYPHRGFALSLRSLLEYMALYPAYKPFCTEVAVQPARRRVPALEYVNGMLAIRAGHPLAGRDCLAASFARRAWLLNIDQWRIVARADNVDSYSLAGDGGMFVARVDGTLVAWRADGGVAARVPRVATWDVVGDGSLVCIANHLAPLHSYDIDIVRLDGGGVAATLARKFDHDVAVRDIAVSRDGAYAALHCRHADGSSDIDIWDVPGGRRVGTLPHAGGRTMGFGPDNRFLMHGLQDGSYCFLDMRAVHDTPDEAFGTNHAEIVVTPPLAVSRIAFVAGGTKVVTWSSARSVCDGFQIYDLEQRGRVVAAQQPSNGFDGLVIADDGSRLAAWRGTMLAAWHAASATVPFFETTVQARVTAMACAPAAALVAAATDDGMLHLWRTGSGEPRPLPPLATGDPGIAALAFEREAKWLAAHSASSTCVYVALLRQGGMFDSDPVVGWQPLVAPPIGVSQATTTAAPPVAAVAGEAPASGIPAATNAAVPSP